MITIPINVYHPRFLWHLDLAWYAHRRVYGQRANNKIFAAVIDQHTPRDAVGETLDISVPHQMCKPYYAMNSKLDPNNGIYAPVNIQYALQQVLPHFNDSDVIEVVDHDMLHHAKHPDMDIPDNFLYVSEIYESWHLRSKTTNRGVIEPYFENGGKYYNGGFVPIIGKVKTFKKILPEWIAIHLDIVARPYSNLIKWWAGMYAFNAACEKKRIRLVGKDYCYVPNINKIDPQHYNTHYSVDPIFNKKNYPHIDAKKFPSNSFYDIVGDWLKTGDMT